MAIVEEVAALREQTLAAVAQAADTAALDQVVLQHDFPQSSCL